MKKVSKTNAMRILESLGIEYDYMTYESEDGKIDGEFHDGMVYMMLFK